MMWNTSTWDSVLVIGHANNPGIVCMKVLLEAISDDLQSRISTLDVLHARLLNNLPIGVHIFLGSDQKASMKNPYWFCRFLPVFVVVIVMVKSKNKSPKVQVSPGKQHAIPNCLLQELLMLKQSLKVDLTCGNHLAKYVGAVLWSWCNAGILSEKQHVAGRIDSSCFTWNAAIRNQWMCYFNIALLYVCIYIIYLAAYTQHMES